MTVTGSMLFQPIQVGRVTLQHRVVLAPLTRFRASKEHIPFISIVLEYYKQRSSTPGTLLISEANVIAPKAGGYENTPGIWSDEQIEAWKKVTEVVHAQGSYIYLQLWAMGRAAKAEVLSAESPPQPYVSASDVPLSYQADPPPRPLTIPEIQEYVQDFAKAASNAVHRAGFDGVEVHAANGYLIDQFLQDVTNKRTDEYGGSIEGRARFGLEILEAITKEIGADRTAVRLSPWGTFQEMGMKDPRPTFSYVVSQIRDRFPGLSYIHLVEPRFADGVDTREESTIPEFEDNNFIRKIWSPRPLISAGGYNRESALKAAEKGDIIAFGRWFISNPDLPHRLKHNLKLTAYDRSTFYVPGDDVGNGYIDYPFADALSSN